MGVSDEDRTKLDETLKELKLSNEECDKFSKAFKDPEFIKLFEEYAKEVSDPKVKDETDLYLRQLESEGRAEEVYGKGTVLVVPKEGYVIRTLEQPSGRKVYINVCTSDKVDKMRMEPRPGPDGKVGRHVELPLTLSSKKSGVDKKGNPCWVWDFVVHPDVLVVAAQTPAISKLVAETAMEQIQGAHGVVCSRQYKQLGMKYKGADGAPAPHVLGVKASNAPCTSTSPGSGAAPSSRLKPVANNSSLPPTPAAAAGAAGGGSAGSAVGSEPSKDVEGQRGVGKESRSAFTFGKGKASKAAAQGPSLTQGDCLAPGYLHPGGEVTPRWEVLHRGQVDLGDSWGDAGRGLPAPCPGSRPACLVLRVLLPGQTSAAGLDLDVAGRKLKLLLPGRYKLDLELPYAVDDTRSKAKFDKVKQQLEVTLPTLLPPACASKCIAADLDQGPGEACAAGGATHRQRQEEQQQQQQHDGQATQQGGQGQQQGHAQHQQGEQQQGALPQEQQVDREREQPQQQDQQQQELPKHQQEQSEQQQPEQQLEQQQHGERGSPEDQSDQALTANQQRWLALHGPGAAGAAVAAAGAGAAVVHAGATEATATGGAAGGEVAAPPFQAAAAFTGTRPGTVFKLGALGLGYYLDPQQLTHPPPSAVRPAPVTGPPSSTGHHLHGAPAPATAGPATGYVQPGVPQDAVPERSHPTSSTPVSGPRSSPAAAQALAALAAAGVEGLGGAHWGGTTAAGPQGVSSQGVGVRLKPRIARAVAEELD